MILFVLEAHGALNLGRGVDEGAQRVAGKRVVVAAGVAGFVIAALGVGAGEEEALDFIGGVERVALLVEQPVGVALEDAANVRGVGRPILVDDMPEDQNFAGAEYVRRRPVERAPIHG